MDELVIANARVVTADRVFRGAVTVRDGVIADIAEGARVPAGATDCEGDYLIPGLVELHTDNLERHLRPRPGVQWPRRAAVAAHDGEFASVGVTTVLDALRVGAVAGWSEGGYAAEAAQAVAELRALGLLRADHYIHLRCELTSPAMADELAAVADDPRIRLVSLMDHTPGQRQFADLERYKVYYAADRVYDEEAFAAHVAEGETLQRAHAAPNRAALLARARALGAAIASHDDATPDHVAESAAGGATLAEFPTTTEAARAARAAGQRVIMGAPNLLRGGSHTGNASAQALAREGLLDILSSDYAPASLMLAAFQLAEDVEGWDLPRAIACVTRTPALAAGLADRGEIAPGLRADLARVYHVERLCVARSLWRAGARVL